MLPSLLATLFLLVPPAPAAVVARVPPLPWATGQVIALSTMRTDPSTLLFETATESRYGHVGILALTPGIPVVYHAYPPVVQKTPLDRFLALAEVSGRPDPPFTLLRPAVALSAPEQEALVAAMEDMVARRVPFNYSMKLNEASVNCSEFVRRAYEAIGRSDLGEPGPLMRGGFDGLDASLRKLFRLREPAPDAVGVSPASIVRSESLRVVHADLPVRRPVSEAEIFQAWRDGGGLDALALRTGVPRERLERLGLTARRKPRGRRRF